MIINLGKVSSRCIKKLADLDDSEPQGEKSADSDDLTNGVDSVLSNYN